MKKNILLYTFINIILAFVFSNDCIDQTYNANYNYKLLPQDHTGSCLDKNPPSNPYVDCDEAITNPLTEDQGKNFTCESLESDYGWNCGGCNCSVNEDVNWRSKNGCWDDGNQDYSPYPGVAACNYNPETEFDFKESCVYPPEGSCACLETESGIDCGQGLYKIGSDEGDYCGDCVNILLAVESDNDNIWPMKVDICGECGGDGPEENYTCDDIPPGFSFTRYTGNNTHIYGIGKVFDGVGSIISVNDWIGVFNDTTCVGSKQYTGYAGDYLTIESAGKIDNTQWNYDGYLEVGMIPSFKVASGPDSDGNFDIFEIFPYNINDDSLQWASLGNTMIDIFIPENSEYSINLNNTSNLISFNALPTDSIDFSVESVMSDIATNVRLIISGGTSAIYYQNKWHGGLTHFSKEKGYWIVLADATSPDTILSGYGFNFDPNREYNLDMGHNLISFPGDEGYPLSAAISSDYNNKITSIMSEGNAALWYDSDSDGDFEWIGGLTDLYPYQGYWIRATEYITGFQFSLGNALDRSMKKSEQKILKGFEVAQSSMQAFYFIKNIKLENNNIEAGDHLLSYNDNVLTGIREWNGEMIDVPVMGSDGYIHTAGYHIPGSKPHFKLLKQFSGEIIPLFSNDIMSWESNGIFIISSLNELDVEASQSILSAPYPNPFNPSTNFYFELFNNTNVTLAIYDIRGRIIEMLIDDKYMHAGLYSNYWNADGYPSGIYFIKLIIDQNIDMKKLMLLK